jgi:hypothetical protein
MKRFIVGLVAAAAFGLIPSSAFATSTKVCVPTHPNQTVDAPESDGECEIGFEGNPFEPYLSVYIGEAGPKGETGATGPEGPKGSTGATGATGPAGSSIVARIRLAEPVSVATSSKVTLPLTTSSWTQGSEELNQLFQGPNGGKAIARTTNPSCTQSTQKLNIEEILTPVTNNNETGPIDFWFETGTSQTHTITLKAFGSYCENSRHETIDCGDRKH